MEREQKASTLGKKEYLERFKREIVPIAYFESCFPEKFGVPRQAGISRYSRGVVKLLPPFNDPNSLVGLELYSHLWLTFGFHQNRWRGRAKVRPQRLGGNARMGVFATRSSFRPNGLGLSAVKIESVEPHRGEILVSEHDLIEGTPIYCIKPYIPFADAKLEATSDFAPAEPRRYPVRFSPEAHHTLKNLEALQPARYPHLRALIEEVVGQNPAPQFHQDPERIYGLSLYDLNIHFKRDGVGDASKLSSIKEQTPLGFLVLSIKA